MKTLSFDRGDSIHSLYKTFFEEPPIATKFGYNYDYLSQIPTKYNISFYWDNKLVQWWLNMSYIGSPSSPLHNIRL